MELSYKHPIHVNSIRPNRSRHAVLVRSTEERVVSKPKKLADSPALPQDKASQISKQLPDITDSFVKQKLGTIQDTVQDQNKARSRNMFIEKMGYAATTKDLPYMLYIPDFDGQGLTAKRQLMQLSSKFELEKLSLMATDTSSVTDIVEYIQAHLSANLKDVPAERAVYLVGDGFGALIAILVASRCQDIVNRLVLVNPALCYQDSPLARIGPLISQLPPALYQTLPLAFAPALGNPAKLAGMASELMRGGPPLGPAEAFKAAQDAIDQLTALSSSLPVDTFKHRLLLLANASRRAEGCLREVTQRTMVVLGERDLVFPGTEAVRKLLNRMPRGFTKVLPNSGHALLEEAGMNLAALMQKEGFYTTKRTFTSPLKQKQKPGVFGGAGPLELPSREEVLRYGATWTARIRELTSPVFLSTTAEGTIVPGLTALPDARPILFVGNHQLYAFDMNVLVEEIMLERGMLLRGLAHPGLFATDSTNGSEATQSGNTSSASASSSNGELQQLLPFADLYKTMGAVQVTPQNFYRLLQNGEAVLLYPGGAREGFKRKNEKYELFWPAKSEFVRMAAKFGAVIVPFAAVGLEDSMNIILDSDEIMNNPWLGPRARELSNATPRARVGVNDAGDVQDNFIPPLIAPSIPSRLYYLFRKPITLSPAGSGNREVCDDVYHRVKEEVQEGVSYLIRKREQDPYKDFLPRYLFENPPNGRKRQAPSFKL